MLGTTIDIPNGVSLLADHLDAALAAGEDLLGLRCATHDDASIGAHGDSLGDFVTELRRQETTVIARLLQARRRATEIERLDRATQIVVNLFVSSTSGLVDLVATFGDTTVRRFDGADDPHAFLRRRGVLPNDAISVPKFSVLTVKDSYLVGGVLHIGGLLDMTASFLDALDRRYGLYPDDSINAEDQLSHAVDRDGDANAVADGGDGADSVSTQALEDVLAEMRKGSEH